MVGNCYLMFKNVGRKVNNQICFGHLLLPLFLIIFSYTYKHALHAVLSNDVD